MKEKFRLTKYYLDCVSKDKSVVILYSAKLKWNLLKLGFMNIYYNCIDDTLFQNNYYKNQSFPIYDEKTLTWNNNYINLNSNWIFKSKPITADLSPENDSSVLWECLCPNADGFVNINSKELVNGVGYVEKLTLTQKPWNLGFDKLYWGRFISEHHYIVWIIWEGKNQLIKVIHNGVEYNSAIIDEQKLQFNNLTLYFVPLFIIRDSFILNGILSNIPFIDKFSMTPVSKIHEKKVFSKGSIEINNKIISGNVISEVVKWK